jgi:hypothetical protein
LWLIYFAAEIAYMLGSYPDLKPARPVSDNEKAAAKLFQDAVGTFVRDPYEGLSKSFGWPKYRPDGTFSKLLIR